MSRDIDIRQLIAMHAETFNDLIGYYGRISDRGAHCYIECIDRVLSVEVEIPRVAMKWVALNAHEPQDFDNNLVALLVGVIAPCVPHVGRLLEGPVRSVSASLGASVLRSSPHPFYSLRIVALYEDAFVADAWRAMFCGEPKNS